jgi:hypothetical protein
LDGGFKCLWVLLENSPLTEFSPTFFGFALQGCHLQTRQLASLYNCHDLLSRGGTSAASLVEKEHRAGKDAIVPPKQIPDPKSSCDRDLATPMRFGMGETTG